MLIQPLDENLKESGDVLVAMDAVQAGEGDIVYYESSKEAGQAFPEWYTPADVAIFGIVDEFRVEKEGK
jgi:microcompartment protein CcmK/EutM